MIPWAALAYPFGPLLGVKGGAGGGGGLKFEWRIESSDGGHAGYSKGADKKIQPSIGNCIVKRVLVHHVIVQAHGGNISERTTHAACLPLILCLFFFYPLLTAYVE